MNIRKVYFIGDTHMTGAGSEWPKLFGHLGPVPNKFRPNLWSNKIRQSYPNLEQLYVEFYSELGEKVQSKSKEKLQLRDKFSFCAVLSELLGADFQMLGNQTSDITDILPYFMSRLTDDDFKDCLVVAGIPKVTESLFYNQKPNSDKLINKSIAVFSSQIFLMKEFVENRGGKFLYFHTEDYPSALYNPEFNPYFIDLLPFRLFEGNLDSILGLDSFWRRFDGKHYDAGTQKLIGQILHKKVVDSI